jgi:hypothetical protein
MKLDVVIVEKSGELKSLTIKEFKVEELYKKCSFKTESNFAVQTQWTVGSHTYTVYGKKEGKSNSINKYDFPPIIDDELFYGNMVLVKSSLSESEYFDLSIEEWEKVYETLFGGFEDIGSKDSEDSEDSEEEEEEEEGMERTKSGYVKDGFVVDSEENSELEYEDYEE